jgi:hypothetical protein
MGDKPAQNEIIRLEEPDLLEFQLDGSRIHFCYRPGNIIPDIESFVPRSSRQVNKKTIGISINNLCSPFTPGMNYFNGLEISSNSMLSKTFSSVSLAVCTILSAISAQGILPENEAEV